MLHFESARLGIGSGCVKSTGCTHGFGEWSVTYTGAAHILT